MEIKWLQTFSTKLKSQFENRRRKQKNQKRPYIIPAKFGFYFGSGILILLILAFTYANQLIYLIAFFYSSFIFIVMHLANNNLKNIKINSYEIPSYFADELGSIQIQLTNEHHKYLTRFIHIEINTSEFEIDKEIEIIKNRDNITVTCKILKSSRGLFPYPRIKIYSTFPFGLFYCWQIHDWQMSYFVYPERVGNIKVPQAFEEIEKELKLPSWLKKDNQNDEFFMHKEYNESDNFKRIDWKVFARKNKFYTKIFSSAEPKIIYVDLNSELDHLNGIPMEIKLKQITKWLFDAQKTNTPCLIKTYNGKFSLLNGKNDYELIFQTLALHSIKGGVSIDN